MPALHAKIIGAGRPMVILHGFLGMSDNWKTLGSRYADDGMQVHLVDQRNHGRSFWSDSFSYMLMAQDLLDYMDSAKVPRAILLGHSMGGKTAMTFATAFPERVERLIVADIAPRYYPPHHDQILGALEALPLDRVESRREADELLAATLPDWGVRQFLLKNLYWRQPGKLGFRFNLDVLKNQMEAIGTALPETARFNGPVLFVRGGESNYIGQDDIASIRAHFPQAGIETIAGAGHWVHAEQPGPFYDCTHRFMES